MTLTEFLLLRIAEDEAEPWHMNDCRLLTGDTWGCDCAGSARVLAECEAKRAIVERFTHGPHGGPMEPGWCWMCDAGEATWRDLALPYADHPDYDEAWKP